MVNNPVLTNCKSLGKTILSTSLVLLILLIPRVLVAQEIDLLLKGGHVIDPKNQIDSKMDVAIVNGKIAQVAADIPAKGAKLVVDVSGLLVTPGLIDMHGHVFQGTEPDAYIANGLTSLPPDGFTFRAGVTTVVDAGSSGWRNFRLFKKQTIDRSQTRILALLNIVGNGMVGRFEEQDVSRHEPCPDGAYDQGDCSRILSSELRRHIIGVILLRWIGPLRPVTSLTYR